MKLGRILGIALKRFFEIKGQAARNRAKVMSSLPLHESFLGMTVVKGKFWSAWMSSVNRLESTGMNPVEAAKRIAEQTLQKLGYIQTNKPKKVLQIQRTTSITPKVLNDYSFPSVMERFAQVSAMRAASMN
jgi:hypothetical protein